ncbi:MAG: SCO1664 family protein [Actinomycetota bacterium]|nr:SCO1664 family protein [Actinomycetota bacterium]
MDGPHNPDQVEAVLAALHRGALEVVGRISESSNVALLVEVADADDVAAATGGPVYGIYKPVRGERPLWDFPDGTLAGREVATFEVSRAGGWDVVPPTVLRDGPLGEGSVQLWIGDPFGLEPDPRPVDVCAPRRVPQGWLSVVDGELEGGRAVSIVHEDKDDVRDVAVLDAVVNNADRKGSHLIRDPAGRLWGYDHGLTFSPEPKLRTVLWGWAGEPLRDIDVDRLGRLQGMLDGESELMAQMVALLPAVDVTALVRRIRMMLRTGRHPSPRGGWPAIPWPAL